MNKDQLIDAIAEKTGMTKVDTKKALDATVECIVETVASGEEIRLIGFGVFDRSERKARTGRNPQTGKEIKIEATKLPRFKAGIQFKKSVAA